MKFKILVALFAACTLVATTGCEEKKEDDKKEDGDKKGKKEKKGKKGKGGDAEAPKECTAYFKLIEDCKEKLGPGYEGAKTAAKALEDTPATWKEAGMEGDALKQAKDTLAKSCKTAADALAPTCK